MGWFKDNIGGLLGGAIGAISSLAGGRRSDKANARAAAEERAMQREFAQNGIRWKVADAKAAGLHPLSALGASTASYSPIQISSAAGPAMAEAGQHLGRAVSAMSTQGERQLQALAIEEAKSRIGETDARRDYYLSEAARNRQFQSPGMPHEMVHAELGTADGAQALPKEAPATGWAEPEQAKRYETPALSPSVASGPTPLWRTFTLAHDLPIRLPGGMQGDAAEVLESLSESWPMMLMVYKENKRIYGDAWGEKFLQRYMPGWVEVDGALKRGAERRKKFWGAKGNRFFNSPSMHRSINKRRQ